MSVASRVSFSFPGHGLRLDLAGPLTAVLFITDIRGTVFYEGREVERAVFDFL